MEEKEEINLSEKSEDIKDFIGYIPHWIIRWGNTGLLLIFILVFIMSWVIKYPDIIRSPLKLQSYDAPKTVVVKENIQLIKLFAQENAEVEKGQILAYLESTAKHDQVLSFERHLDHILSIVKSGKVEVLEENQRVSFDSLGELQHSFEEFDETFLELFAFLPNGTFVEKKKLLEQELTELKAAQIHFDNLKTVYDKDFEISKNDYTIQKQLYEEKVIPSLDLKKEESKLLGKEIPLKRLETEISENISKQLAKTKELIDAEEYISDQKSLFLQKMNTLKSEIENWKKHFILIAPVTGKIAFSTIINEKQNLIANKDILSICPVNPRYFGTINLVQHNFGKIKTKQKTLLKFDGYPFEEFGSVIGEVKNISQVPSEDGTFLIQIDLPNGLKTTHGKNIIYKYGMTASGEIITEETSLIARFFYTFKKALSR